MNLVIKMKNPLNRLFIYGILGLAIGIAMVLENYISKSNSTSEYVIAVVLLAFSVFFLISAIVIKLKQK